MPVVKECGFCKQIKSIVARGWCNSCYQRWSKRGSVEYAPKRVSPLHCKLEGCDKPVVARGYCEYHYRNDLVRGNPVFNLGYGERRKHPLYHSWRSSGRVIEGRDKEWDDFWSFINSVGERPSRNHALKRYDIKLPFGPDNFYWHERIASTECRKTYAREWRKRNPIGSKEHSLRKQYGIGLKEYMQMYESQGGNCAICNLYCEPYISGSNGKNVLAVDHCHDTGKIRGLLCAYCNKAIGAFRDSEKLLTSAIKYLKKHKTPEPDLTKPREVRKSKSFKKENKLLAQPMLEFH